MNIIKEKSKYLPHLQKIVACRVLKEEEQQEFLKKSDLFLYEDEEYIIEQDDTDQAFYAIIQGSVKVMVRKEDGDEVYICSIGTGEVFGEAGIFMKMQRTAGVVSMDKSLILRIDRFQLLDFIKKYPPAGNRFLMIVIQSLLRKLKDTNRELAFERQSDMGQDDVDNLMAELIG